MAAPHSRSQMKSIVINNMEWIESITKRKQKKTKKTNKSRSWIIHKCISHDETWNHTRRGCAWAICRTKVMKQQDPVKLELVTSTLAAGRSRLIWDVFNFEFFFFFFARRAGACLINFDSYIRHRHIICSVKSFCRRAPAFSLCEVDHLKGLLNYTTPAHW